MSGGHTLSDFCRLEGKPSARTIDLWISADEDLSARFARAREIGHDVIAADALRIADTVQVGKIVTKGPDGTTTRTEDMLGHRKLQVWTRLQLLSKWDRRYSGKVQVEHEGKVTLEQLVLGSMEPGPPGPDGGDAQ